MEEKVSLGQWRVHWNIDGQKDKSEPCEYTTAVLRMREIRMQYEDAEVSMGPIRRKDIDKYIYGDLILGQVYYRPYCGSCNKRIGMRSIDPDGIIEGECPSCGMGWMGKKDDLIRGGKGLFQV